MSLFSSSLNPARHDQSLARLAGEEFDLLVVGGGINGVGIALDAASRGLSVAMVEAADFASGTSSKSSKLIHGGLRYLEQYDFKLVREALQERELMVTTLSPHLVKPVAFLYPLQEKFKERTYVGAGMALYDALRGFKRALPWHKHLSQKKISEIAPSLRLDIVTSGYQYFDAQVDDARHTMMIARTAAKYGAVIATRTECRNLLFSGKKVIGAHLVNTENGQSFDLRAKVTVMAAGVWTDPLYEKFGIKAGYSVRMSKGSHIVVPGDAIKSETGIIIKTDISVLFIIPWGERWIVGTTDTDFHDDRSAPLVTREDVDYIIAQANRVLEPKLDRSQVIGVFAGLRPLVSTDPDSPTTKLSREHVVDHPLVGFLSIAGGKYTTYRVMAEDAVDTAVTDLRRITPQSCTETLAIVGADGYSVLMNKVDEISEKFSLDRESIIHLLNRYGSLIEEVLAPTVSKKELLEKVEPKLPYIKAEILYAVTDEGARSVDDVLSRRTRITFESEDHGVDIALPVAELIAPVLGWSAAQMQRSVDQYLRLVKDQSDLVDQVTKRGDRAS